MGLYPFPSDEAGFPIEIGLRLAAADFTFPICLVFQGFRSVFWVFRGREGAGGSGVLLRNRFFMLGSRIFMHQRRFFVPRNRFLPSEDDFSSVFGLLSWSGRVRAGPGTYYPAQESIFHTQELIFHAQDSMFHAGGGLGGQGAGNLT